MNFKLLYILIFMLLIMAAGCEGPTPIISPTHYDRVPRPNNLTASTDTTESGANKVSLNWSVEDPSKVKSYDVHRSFTGRGEFPTVALSFLSTTYIDTSITAHDSIYYYIIAKGHDNFIGQNSDTLLIFFDSLNQYLWR